MVKRNRFKLMQVPALIAIISLISILSSTAAATEVEYALEDVGGGQWVYHYTMRNTTLADPIEQFVIWFEPGLYENLSIVSEPEIGYDWYQDTVEPDPVWLFYGAYRALAWDEGIGVGEYESGFAVRFTYLGGGAPGVQEFDIVDPNEYVSLEAGWTAPVYWVDTEAKGNPEQIGTPDKPFGTIQGAIDTAVDGYTVRVLPGLYEESIDFLGKAITVTSYGATMDDPAIISGTVGNAVKFISGETSEAVIDGFLITSSVGKRGIRCANNSSPTIRNNLIVGCGYVGEWEGAAIKADSGSDPLILFNTITGNYGGNFDEGDRLGAVAIHNEVVNFEGLISHCIISGNQTNDLLVFGLGSLEPGRIRYSNIDDINGNIDWLSGAEVDEYGNFRAPPRFVRAASGPGGYDGDYHLKSTSACINAGDPCYIPWEGATDFDNQGRIIFGRVDVGADEAAPYIEVTKPAGGEVWAAGSSHEIRWESFAIDDIDIYYSINNGADWGVIDAAVSNTGSYEWQLPMVDSDECVVWVASSDEPEDIEYTKSGLFTIHPSEAGPAVESRWPTLGRDSKRSGLSTDLGPVVGCVKWQFDTEGPVYAGATIGADDQVHIACEDGRIYTVDPNTGAQIWVYDPNSPLLSSPTVGADGSIYVGCDNGKLYAIDKDGKLRWTHSTDSFIYSTPAVAADGKVFAGSQDGVLYALGADGSELWSFETGGPGVVGGAILASPAIGSDGTVYVAGVYDPNLYAIDPCDGTIKWICELMAADGGFVSPVVGGDGTIYMAMVGDTNLYAIEPNEGSIIWATDLADAASGWFGPDYEEDYPDLSCWSEPAIGPDGTIYVSFDDPYLRAVNPDGSIKWIKRIGVLGGFTLSVGSDGLIYAACDDRSLYVLDIDGLVLAHFDGSGWLSQPVITALDTIIVSDADNVVWAINIDDCGGQSADLHRPGDVNADWAVDTGDLVLVAIAWLEYDDANWYVAADANRDLYINLADVAVLTNWWMIEE